jgi:hypothetical protein
MNVDLQIVNRALQNIGNAPISLQDKQANNSAWVTARDYYLSTLLESLAEIAWTSAMRRRVLEPNRQPKKANRSYRFVYDMPIDCAKPISLQDDDYFVVEGAFLYTDNPRAKLLYITNGRRLIDQAIVNGGNARRSLTSDYFTGGDARRNDRYEWGDNFLSGGNASRPFATAAQPLPSPPPEAFEDFPDYRELHLEAQFYIYFEKMLSSKYALKLTDKPDLHMAYYQEALAVGKNSAQASKSQSAAKRRAPKLWAEELGLRR